MSFDTCRLAGVLLILLAALGAGRVEGAVQLEPVMAGLNSPLYVAQPRDGSGRLFVVNR